MAGLGMPGVTGPAQGVVVMVIEVEMGEEKSLVVAPTKKQLRGSTADEEILKRVEPNNNQEAHPRALGSSRNIGKGLNLSVSLLYTTTHPSLRV